MNILETNHDIVAVDSGRGAKDILETDARFDLILCDLMMPDVSGIDLHAWLEEHQPPLARQLVFMTGGVFSPRTDEYLERVANILLQKPFDRARLTKLVGDQLMAARSKK